MDEGEKGREEGERRTLVEGERGRDWLRVNEEEMLDEDERGSWLRVKEGEKLGLDELGRETG